MGVEDMLETRRLRELVEPREAVEDRLPGRVVEPDTGRPARVDHGGRHHVCGPYGGQQVDRVSGRPERLGLQLRIVEDHREEGADQSQAGRLEHSRKRLGVVAEIPDRPRLGGGDAERAHLVENALRRQLHSPSVNLANTPGDRPGSDPR